MEKTAVLNLSAWDVAWPLIAGGTIGLGARLGRWGHDIASRGPDASAKPLKPVEPARVRVPVPVTKEEAEELKRQGVTVGRRPKTAASNFLDTGIQGVLAAGAGAGGWVLLDNFLDKKRKTKAERSLQRSRQRVERLIQGTPEDGDDGLHRAMKLAAEIYEAATDAVAEVEAETEGISKTAFFDYLGGKAAEGALSTFLTGLKPLGFPVGVGATLVAARAFQENRDANKFRQRVKGMSDFVDAGREQRPMAVLEPYLEEEDEGKPKAPRPDGPRRRGRPPKVAAEISPKEG